MESVVKNIGLWRGLKQTGIVGKQDICICVTELAIVPMDFF